ncbi:MAG: hypothetical protein EBY15_05845 [Gammaproteobacteria bacterium]|nr:hypothetical protein [Gammaproteobacteria bacterium]
MIVHDTPSNDEAQRRERTYSASACYLFSARRIGCGHGSLSVDAAIRGAKRVVGIDTDPERIDFAAAYLIKPCPE